MVAVVGAPSGGFWEGVFELVGGFGPGGSVGTVTISCVESEFVMRFDRISTSDED